MADGKDWSQQLLIMLITDQFGLAKTTFLVREFWKVVREKSVKRQGISLSIVCGNPDISLATGHCIIYSCARTQVNDPGY